MLPETRRTEIPTTTFFLQNILPVTIGSVTMRFIELIHVQLQKVRDPNFSSSIIISTTLSSTMLYDQIPATPPPASAVLLGVNKHILTLTH